MYTSKSSEDGIWKSRVGPVSLAHPVSMIHTRITAHPDFSNRKRLVSHFPTMTSRAPVPPTPPPSAPRVLLDKNLASTFLGFQEPDIPQWLESFATKIELHSASPVASFRLYCEPSTLQLLNSRVTNWQTITWSQLKDVVLELFYTETPTAVRLAQLHARRQEQGESVVSYTADMIRLAQQAKQTMEQIVDYYNFRERRRGCSHPC